MAYRLESYSPSFVVHCPVATWCRFMVGQAVACIGRDLHQVVFMAASTVQENQYGFESFPTGM